MKFRYYITDVYEGIIRGTDDEDDAYNFASSDEYFVVDSEAGEWLTIDGVRDPIKKA